MPELDSSTAPQHDIRQAEEPIRQRKGDAHETTRPRRNARVAELALRLAGKAEGDETSIFYPGEHFCPGPEEDDDWDDDDGGDDE